MTPPEKAMMESGILENKAARQEFHIEGLDQGTGFLRIVRALSV